MVFFYLGDDFLSYSLYVDCCVLVFYIKDILPNAEPTDIDIIINICKEKIREYELNNNMYQLYKVYENEYSLPKINQAIYLLLNLFKTTYPQYQDSFNRLLKLMKEKIIEEKKERLKK